MFAFITVWNEYIFARVLLNDQAKQTITVWLSYFFGSSRHTDWGALMAASTLTAIPVIVFFLLVQRRIAFGLTRARFADETSGDELASACIFPSFPGTEPPDWVRRFLAGGGGGIVLFAYNAPSRERLAGLMRALRAESPAASCSRSTRRAATSPGSSGDEGSSYPGRRGARCRRRSGADGDVARSIAAELAAVGVNWNLAPVADVNVPANPVIGTRAFGYDPSSSPGTSRPGSAGCSARGSPPARSTGRATARRRRTRTSSCPRSSATSRRGSSRSAPRSPPACVDHDRAHARARASCDGRPGGHPGDLLRDELGFDGVVMADALEMKAVSETVGVVETAVQALEAGVDALCVGHDLGEDAVERMRAALVAKVDESGSGRRQDELRRLAGWATPAAGAADRDGAAAGARPRRLVEGDVALSEAPVVVELRPAREHRGRRGRARLWATRASFARASSCRRQTCTSCATHTVMPGCATRQTSPARSSSRRDCPSGGRCSREATSQRTAAAVRRSRPRGRYSDL